MTISLQDNICEKLLSQYFYILYNNINFNENIGD